MALRFVIHRPVAYLFLAVVFVIGPFVGAPERLSHPAPWITLLAVWLTFTTHRNWGPKKL